MRLALALLAIGSACTDREEARVSAAAQPINVCAEGPTTYGIDVSRYQGDIDWDAVAASGVTFAFIQISRSLTDIDAKYEYNWRRAKEVGILRGAYQRFRPAMDAIAQAELFVEKLGPYEAGDLPPVLDVEDHDELPAGEIAARVRTWLDHVEPRYGLRPIIYTNFYFWRDMIQSADFTTHPLWIANYSATCPLVPAPWTRWMFHQYSSKAIVPGITANTTDVNKFNGTREQLVSLTVPAACGDGMCNGDETSATCATDCGEPAPVNKDHGCSATRAGTDAGLLALLGAIGLSLSRRRRSSL